MARIIICRSATLNLTPSTLNPHPSTLDPRPSSLNPRPSTCFSTTNFTNNTNNILSTLDLKPQTVFPLGGLREAPLPFHTAKLQHPRCGLQVFLQKVGSVLQVFRFLYTFSLKTKSSLLIKKDIFFHFQGEGVNNVNCKLVNSVLFFMCCDIYPI